jgi:drug/metabolite transporter (DMT)-like permease
MSDTPARGIALMCAAMLSLACMDAISKHLASDYSIPQMLAVRFVLFTLFAVLVLCRGKVVDALRTAHLGLQILRSLIICLEVAVFVFAFRYLPLADVHAIAGIAPLLVTGLAAVLLKERINRARWFAVCGGFLGLLVILRPGSGALGAAALIPLAGAVLWAVYQILVRLTSDDSPGTQMLYMAMVGTAVMCVLTPFYWVTPDAAGWAWLVALGVVGSLAHWLIIAALQRAPASQLQPFHYTVLVWATCLGYLVYGDLPDAWTAMGGLVIAVSGMFAWYQGRAPAP